MFKYILSQNNCRFCGKNYNSIHVVPGFFNKSYSTGSHSKGYLWNFQKVPLKEVDVKTNYGSKIQNISIKNYEDQIAQRYVPDSHSWLVESWLPFDKINIYMSCSNCNAYKYTMVNFPAKDNNHRWWR